jgi:hypothetical protein
MMFKRFRKKQDPFGKAVKRAKLLDRMGLYHGFWKTRLKKNIGTVPKDTSNLRLVLGVGRSGTTWIGKTLARSKTPLVYLEEPIFHVIPSTCLHLGGDHTAIPYSSITDKRHERLLNTYQMFANSPYHRQLLNIRNFPIKKDDDDPKIVLIKEVHSLMATEFLVRKLACPVLAVQRNYITVVDSLMNFSGLDDIYLQGEFSALEKTPFLDTYFPDRKSEIVNVKRTIERHQNMRERSILKKALVVYIIQQMFDIVAKRNSNILVIAYEEILGDRDTHFRSLSKFFDMEYTDGNYDFAKQSATHSNPNNDIARSDNDILIRRNKFLSDNDVNYIQEMIEAQIG